MTAELVHVVDDDDSMRKSLDRLLRSSGYAVRQHASAQEFLEVAGADPCGCVILDYRMPGLSGLELQEILRKRGSDWQIVFLSGQVDVPKSVQAMKCGAIDLLLKPAADDQILAAVGRALERCREAMGERAIRTDIERRIASLTPREREVMGLVIAGLLNKQIADTLGTAEKTVKIQRAHVMEKMGVRSVAQLVRMAETVGMEPSTTAR